ncbi:UNVERIFIED_CONTAM: Pantothenate kinase [Sesamum latifolium]|uniref:pantothenate kinase n=1 Tax=Sesamum latifolium TaxID=2727402 RepID=A0AAW2X0G5_9LAMI
MFRSNGFQFNPKEEWRAVELKRRWRRKNRVASRISLDIGGSLIKMVYFPSNSSRSIDDQVKGSSKDGLAASGGDRHYSLLNGRLHFLKFETSKVNDCIDFISSELLQHCGARDNEAPISGKNIIKKQYDFFTSKHHSCSLPRGLDIKFYLEEKSLMNSILMKATGGGAFKFADLFKERLGITLDKVDEMDCLTVHHEAFTYMDGQKDYVQIDHKDLYPYLLVNIGSGVSMIKVESDSKFQRVSGTSVGGGTFWGLGKLLTKCKSFDELLELSHRGNNRVIDMLVGNIYGMDYSKIGLTSTAIASSFGKPISENKELEDYRAEDIARSLLRMISNNIGQIAYLNALRFGLKRIFFGGFFIREHSYTMDTISVAVNFWSKGEAKAMFLRHEGFLGALGAFLSYEEHDLADMAHQLLQEIPQSSYSTEDGFRTSGRATNL